jgi:hypothetical protein
VSPTWDLDRWSETRVFPARPAEPTPESSSGPSPDHRTAAEVDEPAPRRHRRAEPDDELSAPWPASGEDAVADDPAQQPTADAGSGYDGSAYDAMLFGTAASSPGSSYEPAEYRSSWSAYETPVYESPAYGSSWSGAAFRAAYDLSGSTAARESVLDEPAPPSAPERAGHARLEQILAESGVQAPADGRSRRRRYRDEDGGTGDDVLSRVLGRP